MESTLCVNHKEYRILKQLRKGKEDILTWHKRMTDMWW